MKKIKIISILLIVAGSLFSILSCDSEENITFKEGLVRNFGSPTVDGCGWVIIVNDTIYAPVGCVLKEDEFCIDYLKVYVKYRNLASFRDCCWWGPCSRVYPEVEILSIKIR